MKKFDRNNDLPAAPLSAARFFNAPLVRGALLRGSRVWEGRNSAHWAEGWHTTWSLAGDRENATHVWRG